MCYHENFLSKKTYSFNIFDNYADNFVYSINMVQENMFHKHKQAGL